MAALNEFIAGRRADLERKIAAIRGEAMAELDSIKRDFDRDQESSRHGCNCNCKDAHDIIREEERRTMDEIRKRMIDALDRLEADMRRGHVEFEGRIRAANQNPKSFVLVLEDEKTYCIRDYYNQLPEFSGL